MGNMTPEEIDKLISLKVRQHETRVAIISGILGAAILAGIFHAIYLLRPG